MASSQVVTSLTNDLYVEQATIYMYLTHVEVLEISACSSEFSRFWKSQEFQTRFVYLFETNRLMSLVLNFDCT